MYFQDFHSFSAAEQKEHTEKFGGSNDFPPGWRELSEKEFAKSMFFTYHARAYQFRQMRDPADPLSPVVSATLFFMHDGTGYSMISDYWGGKLRFYTFGCDHKWGDASEELKKRGIRLHQHEHAHFCTKCGYLSIVDSSG